MTPVASASIDAVPVPDELARRLARLTGGPPPATLAELTNIWSGQLRDAWRETLLTDQPTVHSVEIGRRSYRVNCALDGLLLPRLARTDGTLTTLDPTTGQTLTVELASTTGTHTTSHRSAVLALGSPAAPTMSTPAPARTSGLFAEMFDAATGAQLGNTPQAFTHIGLINAGLRLAHTTARHPESRGDRPPSTPYASG